MKAATHLAFAGLIAVVAKGLGVDVGLVATACVAAGSLLPDVDTTTSGLGRWVKPVSALVEKKFGHRTITHSLIGLSLLALVTSWLLLINASAWGWLLIGAASHIILDAHNITGVPLLYPLRLEFVSIYNRGLRVPYGSPQEFGFLAGFALTAIALTPLSIDGFSPWFHRALGAPYGAVEDYLLWRNDYEVFVDIDGFNLVLNEDIKQRFRAIDALSKDALLVEDDVGRAYSVALESADIQANKIKAWRGKKLQTSTYRLDLSGRLISDLIHSLPKSALRVHINSELELNQEAKRAPVLGYFERIKITGQTMHTRGATLTDLMPYANYVIEAGSAVIRAEYGAGTELEEQEVLPSIPSVKTHVLAIANLPNLAGLVIELGQTITAGELIARYVDDAALELSTAELEEAKQNLPELKKHLLIDQEAHETKLNAYKANLLNATTNLEKLRYLVERNAEPSNSLIQAKTHLRDAEKAILLEETTWTSQKAKKEQELRQLNLTIAKAEAKQTNQLETQWVRAPINGTISDIRITSITTKGINLEILILE